MIKKKYTYALHIFPKALQMFLNIMLVILAIILSVVLIKELFVFGDLLLSGDHTDYKTYLANILIFFLYFEFIAMIVKYFKEEYHFPLRYFIYIGITAMVRLVIVDHDHPIHTLIYSFVILILIIGYFIINMTPRDRPDSQWYFKRQ
ncbi:phosphate-starvation-inducible protein PsiE [Sporosarcina pasteurii]|uniref:Protein PsiE n=1 Tax=Sporosarcina pasteurii TaxID=1474 RepID=A0A380CB55_SPOPA|nr:phosphate-starvation-inducible protein PsiE [Sporosarcina pasteurii]MDS9472721.1 phosphate-starvation-inducible protein PsiE [Sporosarcina pasteurii]QBQ04376.1 phosphate-starvation-inducible protein PsiE [Sporosarcina pasteurii]SUJ15482.1 phosphate-starvation-inducible protein PsiE [Sporosarcina pasteurii]